MEAATVMHCSFPCDAMSRIYDTFYDAMISIYKGFIHTGASALDFFRGLVYTVIRNANFFDIFRQIR